MGMARLFKATLGRLARVLPDVPRWVETRLMLHSCRCEVLGLRKVEIPASSSATPKLC